MVSFRACGVDACRNLFYFFVDDGAVRVESTSGMCHALSNFTNNVPALKIAMERTTSIDEGLAVLINHTKLSNFELL